MQASEMGLLTNGIFAFLAIPTVKSPASKNFAKLITTGKSSYNVSIAASMILELCSFITLVIKKQR